MISLLLVSLFACVEQKPPVDVGPPQVLDAAVGGASVCVIQADGAIFCWGPNADGFVVPDAQFVSVDGGAYGYCGVTVEGDLLCWGNSPDGGALPGGSVSDYSVGALAICVLDRDGYAACQGDEYWSWPAPADIPSDQQFTRIEASPGGACVLTRDGAVACYETPAEDWDAPPPPGVFTQLSIGWFDGCALAEDGRASCWPDAVAAPADAFSVVAAGDYYACGITTGSELKCWPVWERAVPTEDEPWYGAYLVTSGAPRSGTYVTVDAGSSLAAAVTTDGDVEVFGDWPYGTYADAWFAAHPE